MPIKINIKKRGKALPFLILLSLFLIGGTALITKASIAVDIAWVALAVFGIYMSLSSAVYMRRTINSKLWPQTLYKITNEKIVNVRNSNGQENYIIFAELVYEIDGKRYQKDIRDDFNDISFDSYDAAERYLNLARSNKYKRIYYNPENPEESIIKPGISFRAILAICVGIGLLIIGITSFMGILIWA